MNARVNTMAFVSIKCQNCGNAILMEDRLKKEFCGYCGEKFSIIDEIERNQIENSDCEKLNRIVEIDNLLNCAEQKIEEYEKNGQVIDWNEIMDNYFEKALEIDQNYTKTIDFKNKFIDQYNTYTNEKRKKIEINYKLTIEKYKTKIEYERQLEIAKRKEEEKAEKKAYIFSLFLWIGIPIIVIAVAILVFVVAGSN